MNSLTDVPHWSENVCWFYDTDFEYLADESIVRVVCTGLRCEDYKLRCLMAGVPEDRLACAKDERDAAAMMAYEPATSCMCSTARTPWSLPIRCMTR